MSTTPAGSSIGHCARRRCCGIRCSDQETGLDVYVKHENHNPTSAFKIRGGLNLIGSLSADERRGVITASTGNHGQSIAMACQRERVPCTVVVPEGNNPDKNAAMRAYGRDGRRSRDATSTPRASTSNASSPSAACATCIRRTSRCSLPGWRPMRWSCSRSCRRWTSILVPIGGGSGACGCALVRSWLGSGARVIGVQAAGADAFTRSWRSGERVTGDVAATFAEGIATRDGRSI